MMVYEFLLNFSCGFSAGLLGGYLGVGGGIIMVPLLTVIGGVDIRAAVPVSVTAIAANSFAASNEYLKKGMVDLELVSVLSLVMVMGNIIGSYLSVAVPTTVTCLLLTAVLVYSTVSMVANRETKEVNLFVNIRKRRVPACALLALLIGILAGLVGIGGGEILIPLIFLVVGVPLSTARGTSSLIIGFSAAAASAVYFLNDMIVFDIVAPVVFGIIMGAKIGGLLGTRAKPLTVKYCYLVVMIYLAFRLSWEPIKELLCELP